MFDLFWLGVVLGFFLSLFFLVKSKYKNYEKLIVSLFLFFSSLSLFLFLLGFESSGAAAAVISPIGLIAIAFSFLFKRYEKVFFYAFLFSSIFFFIFFVFYPLTFFDLIFSYSLSFFAVLVFLYIYFKSKEFNLLVLIFAIALFILSGFLAHKNHMLSSIILILAMLVFVYPFIKK